MWFGILIGLAISGTCISIANRPLSLMKARDYTDDSLAQRAYTRIVGNVLALVGWCGAIGWLVEVLL